MSTGLCLLCHTVFVFSSCSDSYASLTGVCEATTIRYCSYQPSAKVGFHKALLSISILAGILQKSMAAFASGTWNLTHSENLDEYMKALGIGFLHRKLATNLTPTQEISVQGENWTIKTTTALRTSVLEFTLNTAFDEDTMDGRKAKSVVRLEHQKLIHDQKSDPDCVITRHFVGNTMTMTLTVKGITATRIYQKQGPTS